MDMDIQPSYYTQFSQCHPHNDHNYTQESDHDHTSHRIEIYINIKNLVDRSDSPQCLGSDAESDEQLIGQAVQVGRATLVQTEYPRNDEN